MLPNLSDHLLLNLRPIPRLIRLAIAVVEHKYGHGWLVVAQVAEERCFDASLLVVSPAERRGARTLGREIKGLDPKCLGAPGRRRVGLVVPRDLLNNALQLDLDVLGSAHDVDE